MKSKETGTKFGQKTAFQESIDGEIMIEKVRVSSCQHRSIFCVSWEFISPPFVHRTHHQKTEMRKTAKNHALTWYFSFIARTIVIHSLLILTLACALKVLADPTLKAVLELPMGLQYFRKWICPEPRFYFYPWLSLHSVLWMHPM